MLLYRSLAEWARQVYTPAFSLFPLIIVRLVMKLVTADMMALEGRLAPLKVQLSEAEQLTVQSKERS